MGRKPLFGECAKAVTLRLYSWEKQLVKEFIKKIREKRRNKLIKERMKCKKV